uniref:Uncharacterized protein n=1 Tax=Rhizophora mucronata TaxID=61149 RepID=A0A2P2JEB4_RHIMU
MKLPCLLLLHLLLLILKLLLLLNFLHLFKDDFLL